MLDCATLKPERKCIFMKKSGCSYIDNRCKPIVEQCKGCNNIEVYGDTTYCKVYAEPATKWVVIGECPLATHNKKEVKEDKSAFQRRKGKSMRGR